MASNRVNEEISISVQMANDKLSNEPDSEEPTPRNEDTIHETTDEGWKWPLSADPKKWPLYSYRYWMREYFGEFFGTMILICFGNGVGATTTFNRGAYGDYQTNASYLAVTFGWGFGLCIALYVSMGISGGHLNPAVSFAQAVIGNFPWRKVPGYIAAQLLGAMTGAACVYGLFKDHFDETKKTLTGDQTMTSTLGGIFCTYGNVSHGGAFWSEFLNTMLLLMGIFGIINDRMTPAVNHKPIAVGLVVFAIGICTGWNSGYAINPARDLGPRLVSAMVFQSTDPFTQGDHYFWIPMLVPFIGATAGVLLFSIFIIPE